MRLLKVSDSELVDFLSDSIPPYAILSHTWGKNEVIYEDIVNGTSKNKSSYSKVQGAANQAACDNFEYVWIDNCCIDKSSSAELSEALNSMYAWYQYATICYAYLCDVPTDVDIKNPDSEFARSRWFTRGFTLQELLAPKEVIFFSAEWKVIGKKTELYDILSTITGIGIQYLRHKVPLSSASIANRMSWAANRQTSRLEDVAYCLLGIFNINMPLLYGERDRAFIRLQEEIMRQSDDQSIFAWRDLHADPNALHGLLAKSPKQFSSCGDLVPYANWEVLSPYSMTNRGLQIEFHLKKCPHEEDIYIAALNCPIPLQYEDGSFLGLFLKKLSSGDEQYARVNVHEFSPVQDNRGKRKTVFIRQTFHNVSAVHHGVYPYHVAQLREGPRSYAGVSKKELFKPVQAIFPEPSSQIEHFKSALGTTVPTPDFIRASEKARKKWLSGDFPHEISLPKAAKELSGAVVFQRPVDKQEICVMLGSMEGFDVGFDAIKPPSDLDFQPPLSYVLNLLQEQFTPKLPGTKISLDGILVTVKVSPWIYHGVKYYMVDYVKSLQRTPSKKTRSRIDPLDLYSVPPRKQAEEIAQRAQMKKLGHIRKTLDKFYAPIEKMDTTTLDRDDLTELRIKVKTCESFDKPDDDYRTFFKPLPEDTLDQYPIDKDTQCPLAIERLSGAIAWGFWKATRNGLPRNAYGHEQSLAHITGWIGSAYPLFCKRLCVPDSMSIGSMFYTKLPADQTWERLDSKKPHFIFTMTHDVEPTERLLTEEALQIMAAIKTRISSEFMENNHQIIPIQMFSFMQNHGRILQAYYNGKRLVIRKTRLYAFDDENAPFDFFIRHLASEPVGYTRELKQK